MGFKVLVERPDGSREVVHETEGDRVIRVGLSGAQGEAAGMRIDYGVGEVLLTFEREITNGRPTLQQIEAEFAPETVHPVEDDEVAASAEEESQAAGEGSTETPPTDDGGATNLTLGSG